RDEGIGRFAHVNSPHAVSEPQSSPRSGARADAILPRAPRRAGAPETAHRSLAGKPEQRLSYWHENCAPAGHEFAHASCAGRRDHQDGKCRMVQTLRSTEALDETQLLRALRAV